MTSSLPQGGCATFLCQPLDVLKTRLMNSKGEYQVKTGGGSRGWPELLPSTSILWSQDPLSYSRHGGPGTRLLSPVPF